MIASCKALIAALPPGAIIGAVTGIWRLWLGIDLFDAVAPALLIATLIGAAVYGAARFGLSRRP